MVRSFLESKQQSAVVGSRLARNELIASPRTVIGWSETKGLQVAQIVPIMQRHLIRFTQQMTSNKMI